jgi:hypothetical protein
MRPLLFLLIDTQGSGGALYVSGNGAADFKGGANFESNTAVRSTPTCYVVCDEINAYMLRCMRFIWYLLLLRTFFENSALTRKHTIVVSYRPHKEEHSP